MRTYDYNDIRKHAACVERGHDFRRSVHTNYFNCKCGASARIKDDRLEIDHGYPKTLEEKQGEREARKEKHLKASNDPRFHPDRRHYPQ